MRFAAIGAWVALVTSAVGAADFPGWRGVNRDGRLTHFKVPMDWPARLSKKWSQPVGAGHSSPVVSEQLIYQFARQNEQEVVACFNFAGDEEWRASYAAPYKMHSAAQGHGKGPKSTPIIANGRLYTFGMK